jgi:hypothetical protein
VIVFDRLAIARLMDARGGNGAQREAGDVE